MNKQESLEKADTNKCEPCKVHLHTQGGASEGNAGLEEDEKLRWRNRKRERKHKVTEKRK